MSSWSLWFRRETLLCVCVCVCGWVGTVYICVCVGVGTYVCGRVGTHLCVGVGTYVCVCMRVCVCLLTSIGGLIFGLDPLCGEFDRGDGLGGGESCSSRGGGSRRVGVGSERRGGKSLEGTGGALGSSTKVGVC